MNRILEVFGTERVLLPVVHPIGRSEALESLRVIADAGVRGAFLINQGMSEHEVLALVREARALFPQLWLGLNLLGRTPADALATALDGCEGRIDGIWSDNAGIDLTADTQTRADELVALRRSRHWAGLYFGGVAFKYQREIAQSALARSAALAAGYMDVVCTSGPGTGQAAPLDKLSTMRGGLGDAALALASGVTAENVISYFPYVNAFLVGTGIEARFGVVDPSRLAALVRAMES